MMVTCWLLLSASYAGGGFHNTAVSKVKGHADEGMVAQGRVREMDRIGNNEADAAADLGRKRVHHTVSDARRTFNRACINWLSCDM